MTAQLKNNQNQQPQSTIQIIKHLLTDFDVELITNFYKNYQKKLRTFGIVSFFIVVMVSVANYYYFLDPIVSIMFLMFLYLFAFISIILSIQTYILRYRLFKTINEGYAIVVSGPAYRNLAMRNVMAWTVGPISITPNRWLGSLIQEGMNVRLFCIPRINMILTINSTGLKYGARMMYPPNLESLAISPEQLAIQEETRKKDLNEIEEDVNKNMKSDERLAKLKKLKEKGLITEKDYENKKKEILVEI